MSKTIEIVMSSGEDAHLLINGELGLLQEFLKALCPPIDEAAIREAIKTMEEEHETPRPLPDQ